MKKSLLLLTTILLNINCDDNPVDGEAENRSPVIFSLTVFLMLQVHQIMGGK